ncbi:MAG: DNA-binding response regulator [Aliarcobacter sp.]|nr:DNA-binding response regulator [Aliarcobacter sp.]
MTPCKLEGVIKCTKNLNVLYVEDNVYVQKQTTKMLESFFNKIYIANNGKEALELFEKENLYNLIITDIEMPLLDGISFIEEIRTYNKKIPIIVLSAHDNKNYFLKTINAGIDGYILKPYTLEQIVETLEKIIEKYDLEKTFDSMIKLDFNFTWDKNKNQLYKDDYQIKLSKNETKLFELFIQTNSMIKTYEEIEYFLFDDCDDNTKKIRNLIRRLKIKLEYDLFESIYSYGYSLKYRQI